MSMLFAVWTACGDSIARAFDAKSGSLKRSFVGHEAAVNCLVLTEGKLYTGSSDGTLRSADRQSGLDIIGDGLAKQDLTLCDWHSSVIRLCLGEQPSEKKGHLTYVKKHSSES